MIDSPKHATQKVLILSDAHIGGGASNFSAYRSGILTLMANYDHVILNGDNIELFLIKPDHARDLGDVLEVITGTGSDRWRKQEFKKSGKREMYPAVENMIRGGELIFDNFCEKFPNTQLHVVLGNHEVVRRFKNTLRDLQERRPNFEWDEEAIRVGDALFTHGHLPLKHKTAEEFGEVRLREAERRKLWSAAYKALGKPLHHLNGVFHTAHHTALTVANQLADWAGDGKFMVSHERQRQPLMLDWIKHVFTGHTHHKFSNCYFEDAPGMLHHNTGAIVQATDENLGILEATLNADGTLTNVRPVKLFKDVHYVRARG